ncbi:MAG: hypothetical protein OXC83_09795 [Chloroflexi bacterium]|nr:hypothetical protein [Chloroflexota bacterium]
MNQAKIRRLRSRLPWGVKQLIFVMQRKALIRAIGSFHATWSELEWRLWALDKAKYENGAFHPMPTLDPRSFLNRSEAHQPVSFAIERLSGKVDLQSSLDELNRRRNRIIHGAISPDLYSDSEFRTGPVLMSSKLIGFAWADKFPIPTLMSATYGELKRYGGILEIGDITELTELIAEAISELDAKYLRSLRDELVKTDETGLDDETLRKLMRYPLEERDKKVH